MKIDISENLKHYRDVVDNYKSYRKGHIVFALDMAIKDIESLCTPGWKRIKTKTEVENEYISGFRVLRY